MAGTARVLRPMEYGQILDESFQLYKENFALVVGICAVVYVPMALLQMVLVAAFGGAAVGPAGMGGGTENIAASLVVLLLVPFTVLMSGAQTKAIADRYLGTPASVTGSYSYIFRNAGPFLLTAILVSLMIMGGMVLCIVPGIIAAFVCAFASQVAAIEGVYSSDAIRRSRELASGQWGRIFGLGLIVGLLMMVITVGLSVVTQGPLVMMLGAKGAMVAGQAVDAAINILVGPFSTIAFILLYFDVRVRKEGFDLELLSRSLQPAGAAPYVAAPVMAMPQTPAASAAPPTAPPPDPHEAFVTQSRAQGLSDGQIVDALVGGGWTESDALALVARIPRSGE